VPTTADSLESYHALRATLLLSAVRACCSSNSRVEKHDETAQPVLFTVSDFFWHHVRIKFYSKDQKIPFRQLIIPQKIISSVMDIDDSCSTSEDASTEASSTISGLLRI